jgi:phage recombination protein Bet
MTDNGTTALATRQQESTAVAAQGDGPAWTEADVRLVRDIAAKGATDEEFNLLLYMARKYKLDPLAKQIWCVKYGNKPAQIFAGRDGFLAIAHASGEWGGMESGTRIEPVGFEVTWTRDNRSYSFKSDFQYVGWARVWRQGVPHPVYVEVWEEEYSTGRDLWANKRRTQITKVAESQALRRQFSISGLYERAEISEDDSVSRRGLQVTTVQPRAKQLAAPTGNQQAKSPGPKSTEYARLLAHLTGLGVVEADAALVFALHNRTGRGGKEMSADEYSAIVAEVISTYSTFEQVQEALGTDEPEEGEFQEQEI